MKNLDSERIVIGSFLLIGWAISTVWRDLILPALVAGGALLLLASGWHPAPSPAPAPVEGRPASTATHAAMATPVVLHPAPARTTGGPLVNTISTTLSELPEITSDLPASVRSQIRTAIERVARENRAA